MLNSYYTEKWTGFQGVEVKKLEKSSDKMVIDEFKGNSGGEKFHAILTDLSHNRVMDIM